MSDDRWFLVLVSDNLILVKKHKINFKAEI